MTLQTSAAPAGDPSREDSESDSARQEWRDLTKGYAIIAGALGLPCLALSVYLREPLVILGWVECVIHFPLVVGAVTLLWIITLWPILFLVGAVIGRYETPKGFRRDSPGIMVCR